VRTTTRRPGSNIFRRALQSLLRQSAENASDEASIVVGKILDKNEDTYGYNRPDR
jgi:chaperonin GroEL